MKRLLLGVLLPCLLSLSGHCQTTHKDSTFYVQLKDGNTLYTRNLQLLYNDRLQKYLLLDSNRQVPIEQVQTYLSSQGKFITLPGSTGTDIFRVEKEGPNITLYSKPILDDYQGSDVQANHANYYFRKPGQEAMQPVTYATLKDALVDNPEAVHQLEVTRTKFKAGVITLVAGALIGMVGIAISGHHSSTLTAPPLPPPGQPFPPPPPLPHYGPSPLVFVGSGLFVVGGIISLTSRTNINKAFNAYNQ